MNKYQKKNYEFWQSGYNTSNVEKDIINKFSIFKSVYVGSYHLEIEPDETNNHHFLILCQKKY